MHRPEYLARYMRRTYSLYRSVGVHPDRSNTNLPESLVRAHWGRDLGWSVILVLMPIVVW